MIRWLVALLLLVWNWILRLFSRRRVEQRGPELHPVVDENRLPTDADRFRSAAQELFAFPLTETEVDVDPRPWETVFVARPKSYRIPDPDFARVLATQTALRSLRWGVPMPEDGPSRVTLSAESWNPPYKVPAVEITRPPSSHDEPSRSSRHRSVRDHGRG